MPAGAPARHDWRWMLQATLAALALFAVVAVAWLVTLPGPRTTSAPGPRTAARSASASRQQPPTPPPPIAPTELIPVTPTDARAINAAVPFLPGPPPPARAFRLRASTQDREAALTCLAAAAWYEAGDDPPGQRAVAQVVLNRLRHPAFPKSVCGVVLQGSERETGCQFTFTCDGSLARRPSEAAWARARQVAAAALDGGVAKGVGTATHYHTDWVVPYWSSSLDKIAQVGTHLFFRWRGWWGTTPAFRGSYAAGERVDARLPGAADLPPTLVLPNLPPDTTLAEVTPGATVSGGDIALPGVSAADLKGLVVRAAHPPSNSFAVQLPPGDPPGSWALASVAICRGRPGCTVLGYLQPGRIPASLPIPTEQIGRASFVYRRGADASSGRALWHCGQVRDAPPGRCFPGTEPAAPAQTR